MSNQYSPEAQKEINNAENKLGDAIKNLKSQIKEPKVEIIPEPDEGIEVELESQKKEPRRSEFVKTDDPKVLERINDLYGQVKQSDKRNQMILEHNRVMEEKLAEYHDKLSKFEQNTKNTASNQVETELKTKLRQAREEHDLDAIEQIEDKLLDLRMEKRLAAPIEKPQPKINPQQQQIDKEFLKNAAYVEVISQERDSNGNPLRGYLFDGHPDNWKALQLFQTIPQEFAAAGKQADIKTVMDVMDERIRGKKPKSANVLSGNDDDISERQTVKLTQQQAYTAKRMGISPEAYARQLSMINS